MDAAPSDRAGAAPETPSLEAALADLAALTALAERRAVAIAHYRRLLPALNRASRAGRMPGARWLLHLVLPVPPVARQVRALEASDLFDAGWYRAQGRGLRRRLPPGLAPAAHYVLIGAAQGRDPSPGFDTIGYWLANPDVAERGFAALAHYLMEGRAEGRATTLDTATLSPGGMWRGGLPALPGRALEA